VRVISDFHTTTVSPMISIATAATMSPLNTDRNGLLTSLTLNNINGGRGFKQIAAATTTPTKELTVATAGDTAMVDIAKDFHGIGESGLHYVEHITTSAKHSPAAQGVTVGTNNMFDVNEHVEMKFDLVDTPAALIHQGALPKADLSKVVVKIQVLYKIRQKDTLSSATAVLTEDQEGADEVNNFVYLAGAKIPLVQILSKANEGKLLEVEFEQRAVEITVPLPHSSSQSSVVGEDESTLKLNRRKAKKKGGSSSRRSSDQNDFHIKETLSTNNHLQYVGDDITLVLPGNKSCKMTLSCIASHKLLQDWNLLVRRR